jgi:phosphopantothenoylcysteine decarboxylase/phosphopantothenate--cysteine ligase
MRNIEFLKNKVEFIEPKVIEGKAKIVEPEEILNYVLDKFGRSSVLYGKKILITGGPTMEPIDTVRVLTNQSSGKTGVLLAKEMISAGGKVTLVYGPGTEKPPKGARIIPVNTVHQMFDAVKKELGRKKFDIVILSAAPADYTTIPVKSKIKSDKTSLIIKLQKAPKIIDSIKKLQKGVFLVGFKAETDISKQKLVESAKRKMKESDSDIIVANDIGTRYQKNPELNHVIILDKSGKITDSGRKNKADICKFIRKQIEKNLV